MSSSKDRGNVLVEFIVLALVLLIPISYISVYGYEVARTYLTMNSAVRSATRIFVIQESVQTAKLKATLMIEKQLVQAGFSAKEFPNTIRCSTDPCLTPGGFVTISVAGYQRLNPPFGRPILLRLRASQTMEVDSAQ